MFDYTFFALLFLLAQSLAPAGSTNLVLENVRHPDQRMEWSRQSDGRWAMTINDRELGHFERTATHVLHHTGMRSPDHFPIAELAEAADLRGGARVRLSGRFAPRVVEITSEGRARILTDPSRELIRTPLRLRASR